MARVPCVYTDTDNHSDDLLAIYHGNVKPTYMCGYHEQSRGIPQGQDRHFINEQHETNTTKEPA